MIKQKNSNTFVILDGYTGDLNDHPAMVEHPESFEITNEEPNEDSQYLNYESKR